MTLEEFRVTLRAEKPPGDLSPLLNALWWDARGDFDRAHEIAQNEPENRESAWVHAYLHRKEGDDGNAGYWYRCARQSPSAAPSEEEWRQIATVLLERLPA